MLSSAVWHRYYWGQPNLLQETRPLLYEGVVLLLQDLMAFGPVAKAGGGGFDWEKLAARQPSKTLAQVEAYGTRFLKYLGDMEEGMTAFADGTPVSAVLQDRTALQVSHRLFSTVRDALGGQGRLDSRCYAQSQLLAAPHA